MVVYFAHGVDVAAGVHGVVVSESSMESWSDPAHCASSLEEGEEGGNCCPGGWVSAQVGAHVPLVGDLEYRVIELNGQCKALFNIIC